MVNATPLSSNGIGYRLSRDGDGCSNQPGGTIFGIITFVNFFFVLLLWNVEWPQAHNVQGY